MSFLAKQRSAQLLYETLDTLIEVLTAFKSDSFSFVGRQTDKSKDQAPKQHHISITGPGRTCNCAHVRLFHYLIIKLGK